MSVIEPFVLETFTISIYKSLVANPAVRWRNAYTAQFVTGSTPGNGRLMHLAEVLLDYEKRIHLGGVQFVQTTISTAAADSTPYDPTAFITIPHPSGVFGTRTISSDPLDLTAAFYVRRQVASGRQGKLFYRGVLGEQDVSAPSGVLRLTNPTGMQTLLQDAIGSSDLDAFFYPAAAGDLMLVLSGGGVSRQILAFQAAGATRVSNDHRWYNVTN